MNFNLLLFCVWLIRYDPSVTYLFTECQVHRIRIYRFFHPTLLLATWQDTALKEPLELDRTLELDPQRERQEVGVRKGLLRHCEIDDCELHAYVQA